MAPPKTKKSHHHGNLREALIQAGIALLDEGGKAALTLRKCAARAGVSHAAPAHYFSGLSGLMTAIVARGFEIFTTTMVDKATKSGPDPHARLLAICNGYLQFSHDHEAMFNLMFWSQNLEFDDPDLRRNSEAAYQVLCDGCAPFSADPENKEVTEIMVWSLVHGYAGLSRSARNSPDKQSSHDIRFEDILPVLRLKTR